VRALHYRTYNVKGSALALNKMSSKFFRTGDDTSSESSSEEEEELYSEEDEEEQQASEADSDEEGEDESSDESGDDKTGVKKTGAMAFWRGAGSDHEDSSGDEQVHVVKSAKDKRLEELEGTVKAIDNGKKINDWGSISAGLSCCLGDKVRIY
jgi:translation initiation factor 3 subunit C